MHIQKTLHSLKINNTCGAMTPLTIGVAVPCYKGHIPLLPNLLTSIEEQTLKPDIVIVSCSSSTSADVSYSVSHYSFPVHIIFHPEKMNAAQNRNIAASYLTTDIITFIDADDIMHPQRISIIKTCFTQYPHVVILLHSCKWSNDEPFEQYHEEDNFHFNQMFQCPYGSTQHQNNLFITNGHPSVPRLIFSTLPFDENPTSYGKEDTVFCTRIISMFPDRTAYCPYELSRYLPSSTGGHQHI
jgi:glycosyltransferase involved in cell wall biosynthesis